VRLAASFPFTRYVFQRVAVLRAGGGMLGMPRKWAQALLARVESAMAGAAHGFVEFWTKVERTYRRPFSRGARRLGFAFYPLLACGALLWLGWDWSHTRSLDAAEDAIFDKVVKWRPLEPKPSGRVVVVEIDDCSIEHFRMLGEGGWPWSRQRHADLLDALDRAGVRAVGYDVLFPEASQQDPIGDATLEAMAEGGAGRFLFAASRAHADFDAGAPLRASEGPSAFPLLAKPKDNPPVAVLVPYGAAMRQHSAITNITRNEDGVLRDIPLRENAGDWAFASLPLQLAIATGKRSARSYHASVRPNWRRHTRLPFVSAADLLADKPVCEKRAPLPALRGRVALVGHTAEGLSDAKPTPVKAAMPGVEIMAEATEALVAGSAITSPPTWVKYVLAAVLVLLTIFAFFRGEPANDIDSIFIATNLMLLSIAFVGLTVFGYFFDIFASIGFVSLCFGLCRLYAGVQRGRAVGNNDYLDAFDPDAHRWLVMARLRFAPDAALDPDSAARRRREYRRRLRRFLYAGCDAVMLEGVVERKSWLHESLDDLMVLVWKGPEQSVAREIARNDLDALYVHLNEHDLRLDNDGTVLVCVIAAQIDDGLDASDRGERLRLREVLGSLLNSPREWPLAAGNTFVLDEVQQSIRDKGLS
ncbi:MAG: CHASE2 domain-containing protein, partial [Pseudomonadota bacterium]|nr:CHASE2 domain-containing protein [Pseudomonadota bacterium]